MVHLHDKHESKKSLVEQFCFKAAPNDVSDGTALNEERSRLQQQPQETLDRRVLYDGTTGRPELK